MNIESLILNDYLSLIGNKIVGELYYPIFQNAFLKQISH